MTICLDTVSKAVSVKLNISPANTEDQVVYAVHYGLKTLTAFQEKNSLGYTNGTTNIDIVAPPAADESISIKDIYLYNPSVVTLEILISIRNVAVYFPIKKISLESGKTWRLSDSLNVSTIINDGGGGGGGGGTPPPEGTTVVVLTQAAYDLLSPPVVGTYYLIGTGASTTFTLPEGNIISVVTQAEYDLISVPDPNTYYLISD